MVTRSHSFLSAEDLALFWVWEHRSMCLYVFIGVATIPANVWTLRRGHLLNVWNHFPGDGFFFRLAMVKAVVMLS